MATNNTIFVGRIFTTGIQDTFKILIGDMTVVELANRTAGWAYMTNFNGKFLSAPTGMALLQTIQDIDEDPTYLPNSHSREVTNYLEGFWNTSCHQFEENGGVKTTEVFVQSLMAEVLPIWFRMCEYLESNYDKGKLFSYLDNNHFTEGDMYPILTDWDVTELRDRSEAYESDRNLALSRLANHYFAVANRMHNLGANQHDVAHAMAAFLDFLDQYNSDV